ncbi:MAG TPA: hypothetical protein VJM49_02310 [Acidimicrobiales bacterium]|nr:hypothetical protein [Acidimicrobiales bacterium]
MLDPHGALSDDTHRPAPTGARRGDDLAVPTPTPSLPDHGDDRLPTLDADGLLRHRGRWVPIPDTQLGVVALLVRNLGRLVGTSEVRTAYEQAGGSGSSTSLRSLVHRLGRRVAEVGLHLHVVRSRGLVLDLA